jgi:NADP-dependent 3-hydroxy acid dehydrogenase YdfG
MTTDQDSSRVAVITGASSGIGEASARAGRRRPPACVAGPPWRAHPGSGCRGDAAGAVHLRPAGRAPADGGGQPAGRDDRDRGFLDQLREEGGDLVNISSVAGRTARVGNAAYAATKWGINGWSEGLRQELQPDIRVMVIEPGAVATELTDHITHAETKQATKQFVQDLAITPQDIAEVIAFAVSRPRRMTLNEILVRPTAQV